MWKPWFPGSQNTSPFKSLVYSLPNCAGIFDARDNMCPCCSMDCMPAPAAASMKQLARLKFASAKNQRVEGPGSLRGVQPIDAEKFLDGISDAICSAWAAWQAAATIVGVVINGPMAMGGQIIGPPLTPLILAGGPKGRPQEMKLTSTVANVIGTAWLSFTATVKVAGMPWYPAFAALPSPVAPPTPNIPCPFAALTMVPATISASVLKSQMLAISGESGNERLFDAIGDAFEKSFNLWRVSTMVTNVLGTGPVPTFAPPYVPVGPVVGGIGTMIPGGFT